MSVRINGSGTTIPVNTATTAQTRSAKQQTTTQATGYSSASSFDASAGATPDEVKQITDSFSKYVDFSATANGGVDTNTDADHVTLSMMANSFGKVPTSTRDRLCKEAQSQVDALVNQQPPLSKDQLDAKVKDVKDSLRQKMEMESFFAKQMDDIQKKVEESTKELWGSPWGG